MYSLTFRVRVMLPQQRNPCTDCKSASSAQVGGTGIPYHSAKLHPGPCNSVGMRPRQIHRQTRRHTQTRVTTIHFYDSREM